ncbi:unnamed protein product, partial [Ectocarpus sp. 13 AM-2016]
MRRWPCDRGLNLVVAECPSYPIPHALANQVNNTLGNGVLVANIREKKKWRRFVRQGNCGDGGSVLGEVWRCRS